MSEKLSVLLIEDDIHDVEAVQRAFRTVQPPIFHLEHVPKFRDAIQIIRTKTFHVVILDLGLPDSVGLNGVERLIKLIPTVPIVVLTGWDDDDTALKGIAMGAQEVLDKNNVSPAQLIRTIRHATKRKQYALETGTIRSELAKSTDNLQYALDKLAEIMQETSDAVHSRTKTLMKTELTDQQRDLISDIEKSSRQALSKAQEIASESVHRVDSEQKPLLQAEAFLGRTTSDRPITDAT